MKQRTLRAVHKLIDMVDNCYNGFTWMDRVMLARQMNTVLRCLKDERNVPPDHKSRTALPGLLLKHNRWYPWKEGRGQYYKDMMRHNGGVERKPDLP